MISKIFSSTAHAEDVKELQRDISKLVGGATKLSTKHEREILELIDARDNAEQALSQAYYLVIGRSPEWSNMFGYKDALQDIEDACFILRTIAKEKVE